MIGLTQIIGFLGALTAATLFFPQVYISFKSKKTKDIAWSAIYIGMLNGFFWTTYGVLVVDHFIYVTNTVLFFGAFLLFLLKRKYK